VTRQFELGPAEQSLQAEARALASSVSHLAAEADAMSEIHPGVRDAAGPSVALAGLMVPGRLRWAAVIKIDPAGRLPGT